MKKCPALLLLLAFAVLCLGACGAIEPEPTTQSTEQEAGISMNKKTAELSELCDALEWCGKTPQELGLEKETDLELKGKLFGAPADGQVFFLDMDGMRVHSVYLYVNTADLSFDACRAALSARYETEEEGEEPYAAANGGVVSWVRFVFPAGTLVLSKGERHDWYKVEATAFRTAAAK